MGAQNSKVSPYEIGETRFTSSGPLKFTVCDAVRNSDQEEFSIFQIKPDSELSQELAANFVRSWKIYRHPSVAQFVESYEENGEYFVVTERLVPFSMDGLSNDELAWALHSLISFVSFMDERSSAIHGNLTDEALFLTSGNELKIVGLQWASGNGTGPIYEHTSEWEAQLPFKNTEFSLKVPCSVDCRFVGNYVAKWNAKLPRQITKLCRSWIVQNRGRMSSPSEILSNDYWENDKFVQYITFLDEIAIKDNLERDVFLKDLTENLQKFSEKTQTVSILPKLISTLSFSPTPSVIAPILSIGKKLESRKFAQLVVPNVIGLFENKDRALRIHLLNELDSIVPYLDKKVANEQIFSNIIGGLLDPSPQLKQATIIAMVPLAPLLNTTSMKSLIRELKGLQMNQDPQVRTNALVCVAKIAKHIDAEIRQSALTQVFGRATKDTFWGTRQHAIGAYLMCMSEFSDRSIAIAVIPSISPLCVDEKPEVKEKALRALQIFVDKLNGIERPKEPKATKPTQAQKPKIIQQKPAKHIPMQTIKTNNKNEEVEKIAPKVIQPKKTQIKATIVAKDAFDDNDGWDDFDDDFNEEEEKKVVQPIKVKQITNKPKAKPIKLQPKVNKIPEEKNLIKPKISTVKKIEVKETFDDNDGWDDFDDEEDIVIEAKPEVANNTKVNKTVEVPPKKEEHEDKADGWSDIDDDNEFDVTNTTNKEDKADGWGDIDEAMFDNVEENNNNKEENADGWDDIDNVFDEPQPKVNSSSKKDAESDDLWDDDGEDIWGDEPKKETKAKLPKKKFNKKKFSDDDLFDIDQGGIPSINEDMNDDIFGTSNKFK